MSEEHVAAVFGPPWVRESVERLERHRDLSEEIILALRRRLRTLDPELPDIYDGHAWYKLEKTW